MTAVLTLKTKICPECGRGYGNQGILNEHIKSVHKVEEVRCEQCGKEFKNQSKLRIHQRLMHRQRDTVEVCDQCSKSFKTKRDVYHHKKAVHTLEITKCHLCGSDSKNEYAFRKHVRKCYSKSIGVQGPVDKPHSCTECGKRFFLKYEVKKHINIVHTKMANEMCTICGEAFILSYKLKNHMVSKHGLKKDFECEKCKGSFISEGGMKKHKCNVDGFPCNICDQMLSSKYEVQKHLKTHSNIKIDCGQCGKHFLSQQALKQHVSIKHEGIRAFSCNTCSKTFPRRSALRVHSLIHTGEMPYSCNLCEVKYRAKRPVVVHMMKVHGIDYKSPPKVQLTEPNNTDHDEPRILLSEYFKETFEKNETLNNLGISEENKIPIKRAIVKEEKEVPEVKTEGEESIQEDIGKSGVKMKSQMDITEVKFKDMDDLGDLGNEIKIEKDEIETNVLKPDDSYIDEEETFVESIEDENDVKDQPFEEEFLFEDIPSDVINHEDDLPRNIPKESDTEIEVTINSLINRLSSEFACLYSECNYKSKYKSAVKKHVRNIHMGDVGRKFPCEHCKYVAKSLQAVKGHMAAIHENIEHLCPECDFRSKWKQGLDSHIKVVHQGIDPAKLKCCPHCEYKTHRKNRLDAHINGKHIKDHFYCEQCTFKTTWKHKLYEHAKSVHK